MKKIKSNIVIISILALFIITDFIKNDFFIKVKYISLFLMANIWVILLIKDDIKYRKGKILNEIKFPFKNDSYLKVLPLFTGSISIFIAYFMLVVSETIVLIAIPFIVFGILKIIHFLNYTPSCYLRVTSNKLKFSESDKQFDIDEITTIKINSENILIINNKGQKISNNHLDLDNTYLDNIQKFLSDYFNRDIIDITNNSLDDE
jgi:cellulose synthase/poly-beta-1,6-N-acetylglucosamine synthase-like glycosyltransferase